MVGYTANHVLEPGRIVECCSSLTQAFAQRSIEIVGRHRPLRAGSSLLLPCPANIVHVLLASATRKAHFQRSAALTAGRHTAKQRLDGGILTAGRSAELQLVVDGEPEVARDNRLVLP